MELLGQTLINGLLIGGVYALISVGQTLIFGVMKIVNFAQGEFLMVGLYVTLMLAQAIGTRNPYLLIIPVGVLMFCFGMIVYQMVVKHVVGKGATSYILLTVGLSYFLQNVAQMIWTANPVGLDTDFKTMSLKLSAFSIAVPRLIAFAIAVAFMIAVNFFLNKTDMGRAMRATSEDTTVAKLLGIDTKKMFLIAFGLGTMFAAIAGCIVSPIYYAYPRVGTVFSTTVYSCVVIGGLGNIKGAFIGGLIIGIIEALAGSYLALALAPTCVYAVLMLFLIFKPQGLFGGGGRRV